MKKNIKDYLQFYLGCDCIINDGIIETVKITGYMLDNIDSLDAVQPFLRKLSSMTEEESKIARYVSFNALNPKQFQYLLSKGFDLFGLIDSNLAIEEDFKQLINQ